MKWEYKSIELENNINLKDSSKLQEELNNYGSQGWELVGVMEVPREGSGWLPKLNSDLIVFKRALEN